MFSRGHLGLVAALIALVGLPTTLLGQQIDKWRFTPLEVGDYWEYTQYEQDWPWDSAERTAGQPGPMVPTGRLLRTWVDRDTLIDGSRYVILSRELFIERHEATEQEYSCAIRILESGDIQFPRPEGLEGECQRWDATIYQFSIPVANATRQVTFDAVAYTDTITIGNTDLAVAATATDSSPQLHGSYFLMEYAFRIGLYRWTHFLRPRHSAGWILTLELHYARVGGLEIGSSLATSTELDPMPSAAAVRLDGVFPNPSSGAFSLKVAASKPARATVEVFDPLGRTVHRQAISLVAGSTSVSLSLPEASAGLYFVQLSSDGAAPIVRPVAIR